MCASDLRVLNVLESKRTDFFGVFLDVDPEVRWDRKYTRDTTERKECAKTLRRWFDEVIRPAEKCYLEKQKELAHRVIK